MVKDLAICIPASTARLVMLTNAVTPAIPNAPMFLVAFPTWFANLPTEPFSDSWFILDMSLAGLSNFVLLTFLNESSILPNMEVVLDAFSSKSLFSRDILTIRSSILLATS